MKKLILVSLCGLIASLFITISVAATPNNNQGSFNLVHWNVIKQMYRLGQYVYYHHETLKELQLDPKFLSIIDITFTPDSYAAVFDQNAITRIHPDNSIIGKKMSVIDKDVSSLMEKSIKRDTCVRGFYIWIDKQEKYMVACPIIGKTKDGYKLYYGYTMYTRSIPDYYIKTLKNSVLD